MDSGGVFESRKRAGKVKAAGSIITAVTAVISALKNISIQCKGDEAPGWSKNLRIIST